MTTPHAPTKYLGPNQYLGVVVVRQRPPTLADYLQPETGKNYPIGCVWQVGANPTSGTQGDLYMLSKIVANQGYWIFIQSDLGQVESFVTNIGGPVVPDASGEILVNASVTTFTDGSVTNTLKTEVQAANHQLIVGRGTNVAAGVITAGTQGTILAQNAVGSDAGFTRTVNGDANMTFQAFTSGVGHFLVSQSPFTASGSNAGLVSSCVGGAGIPLIGCTISASRFFAESIDQTDSDAWKLATGANSNMTGGALLRRTTTTGIQTMPLQPAFLAYNAANVTNATGDGTVVTVALGSESFDQGANFGSSTYTNPQTSKVLLTYTAGVFDLGAAHTSMVVQIIAGGQTYEVERFNPGVIREGASNQVTVSGSVFVSMTASQTAVMTITVSGDTKTVGITGTLSTGVKFGGFVPC